MKINGIQQLGVGVEDIHEAWDWYRKYFSMDILMFDEEAVNTVYNIGSGVHYRNIDLVNMISEILGKDVNFKFVADRLGHDRAYRLNCTKLKKYYKDNNFDMKYYNIKDYLLKLYGNDSGK